MADMRVRLILEAIDRASKPLSKVGAAVQQIAGRSGLGRVAHAAGGVQRASGDVIRTLGRIGAVAAAGSTAAAASVAGLVKAYAGAGDAVAKASAKLGVGVEWLQRHRYAADLSGISTETFDMALQRFTRRAAEAAGGTGEAEGALRYLGIQLKDSEGRMRPVEQLLPEVADAMQRIENPAMRVRVAFKLFDSEGVKMIQMLKDGAAPMAKLASEADRLGIVLSARDAKRAEEFRDALGRLGAAMTGLRNAIGSQLLPVLQPLIDRFRDWAVANRDVISARVKEFVDRIAAGLPDFIEGVKEVAGAVSRAARAMWDFFEPLGGVKAILAVVGAIIAGPLILALVNFGAVLLTTPVGWFLGAVAAIAGAAYLVYDNWEDIAAWFEGIWRDVTAAFDGAVAGIGRALDEIGRFFDAKMRPIMAAFAPVVAFFQKLWDGVTGAFDGAEKSIGRALDAIGKFFDTKWKAITKPLDKVLSFFGLGDEESGGGKAAARPAFRSAFTDDQGRPIGGARGGALGPARAEVGGRMEVMIRAQQGLAATVTELKSKTRDFEIDADAGPYMAY